MVNQKLEDEVFVALLNSMRAVKEMEKRQQLSKSLQHSIEIIANEKELHPTADTVKIVHGEHPCYNIVQDRNDGIYYLQCKCSLDKIFFPSRKRQTLEDELSYLDSNV
ncbi:MAG: hypothetical protein J6J57_06755 [Alistipes sp.]|nr:hypothetical protein [Alistipes sp.]